MRTGLICNASDAMPVDVTGIAGSLAAGSVGGARPIDVVPVRPPAAHNNPDFHPSCLGVF
jgi:hypothetical protein